MRGIGGPLLTIGDLLSDVGGENVTASDNTHLSSSSSIQDSNITPPSGHLTKLFQENYDQLNEAFAGSDHSWTVLTLKVTEMGQGIVVVCHSYFLTWAIQENPRFQLNLCTAVETANKLVQSTNTNVSLLSEKVLELEKVVKREDSAIAAAKAINVSLNLKKA